MLKQGLGGITRTVGRSSRAEMAAAASKAASASAIPGLARLRYNPTEPSMPFMPVKKGFNSARYYGTTASSIGSLLSGKKVYNFFNDDAEKALMMKGMPLALLIKDDLISYNVLNGLLKDFIDQVLKLTYPGLKRLNVSIAASDIVNVSRLQKAMGLDPAQLKELVENLFEGKLPSFFPHSDKFSANFKALMEQFSPRFFPSVLTEEFKTFLKDQIDEKFSDVIFELKTTEQVATMLANICSGFFFLKLGTPLFQTSLRTFLKNYLTVSEHRARAVGSNVSKAFTLAGKKSLPRNIIELYEDDPLMEEIKFESKLRTIGIKMMLRNRTRRNSNRLNANNRTRTNAERPANATGTERPANATGTERPAHATGTERPANATGAERPANATGAEGPANATGAEGPANATGAERTVNATGAERTVNATGAERPANATGAEGPANATGAEGTDSGVGANARATPDGTNRGTGSNIPEALVNDGGDVPARPQPPQPANFLSARSSAPQGIAFAPLVSTESEMKDVKTSIEKVLDFNKKIMSGLSKITREFDTLIAAADQPSVPDDLKSLSIAAKAFFSVALSLTQSVPNLRESRRSIENLQTLATHFDFFSKRVFGVIPPRFKPDLVKMVLALKSILNDSVFGIKDKHILAEHIQKLETEVDPATLNRTAGVSLTPIQKALFDKIKTEVDADPTYIASFTPKMPIVSDEIKLDRTYDNKTKMALDLHKFIPLIDNPGSHARIPSYILRRRSKPFDNYTAATHSIEKCKQTILNKIPACGERCNSIDSKRCGTCLSQLIGPQYTECPTFQKYYSVKPYLPLQAPAGSPAAAPSLPPNNNLPPMSGTSATSVARNVRNEIVREFNEANVQRQLEEARSISNGKMRAEALKRLNTIITLRRTVKETREKAAEFRLAARKENAAPIVVRNAVKNFTKHYPHIHRNIYQNMRKSFLAVQAGKLEKEADTIQQILDRYAPTASQRKTAEEEKAKALVGGKRTRKVRHASNGKARQTRRG
jgi:hypothetical protein